MKICCVDLKITTELGLRPKFCDGNDELYFRNMCIIFDSKIELVAHLLVHLVIG
jgi:hypothetical protein